MLNFDNQIPAARGQCDHDQILRLQEELGADDFAEIATTFCAEIKAEIARLSQNPECARAEDFHALRGAASNLGLETFCAACIEAELACQMGALPDIGHLATLLAENLETLYALCPDLRAASQGTSAPITSAA